MDKLYDLYSKYSNFTAYRNETLSSIDKENETLKIEIKKLELEKKQLQLEFEMKIHELKSQLSTTTGKARVNDQLNSEKVELKQELYSEIVRLYEHGVSARDIASHLGLSSTTLIYQAINSNKTTKIAGESFDDIEWNYYDNAAIHRYAVSFDRQYVKIHGNGEQFKIVTVEGLRFVAGDQEVKMRSDRVQLALDMFDGKIQEGEYIDRPNPYREAA